MNACGGDDHILLFTHCWLSYFTFPHFNKEMHRFSHSFSLSLQVHVWGGVAWGLLVCWILWHSNIIVIKIVLASHCLKD